MSLPDLSNYGYNALSYLGRGSEGVVVKASFEGPAKGALVPNKTVAVKITPAAKLRPNEVLLQARVCHISVIQLYDVFKYVLA
jgi:hypothetical protein